MDKEKLKKLLSEQETFKNSVLFELVAKDIEDAKKMEWDLIVVDTPGMLERARLQGMVEAWEEVLECKRDYANDMDKILQKEEGDGNI